VKVAPEGVLSKRGESPRYALDWGGFSPGEVFARGGGYLGGVGVISIHLF